MDFPVHMYRRVFCKIRDDKTSLYINHLIICKYGKRNPIFNTIKGGQKMCGIKLDVERMTGRTIYIAY